MKAASGTSAIWEDANLWLAPRDAPLIVVLGGIDSSEIVDAALGDSALLEAAMVRFEPTCAPPCDALLWRVEAASGEAVNQPGLVRRHWHRAPHAMTVRLVRYQPGSVAPEILDEGTLCTRGPHAAFKAAVDRLAMRFVRDAALGRGRGPADRAPAAAPHGLPGWLDAIRNSWRDRLMAERWHVGTTSAPLDEVLSGGGLGDVTWSSATVAGSYLSGPFPLSGSFRMLSQETPLTGGTGRNLAVAEKPLTMALDDGSQHAHLCTLLDGDNVYCVPHSPLRGTTRIYRLSRDGQRVPVCDPAPYARLANPTVFRWQGRYWLACTDLDVGSHDNLCLLHAPAITGPWTPHARWPVKIDVRGARPAGMLFNVADRLFRPAQDCAAIAGSAVAIHEVLTLTETDFRESLITVLRPDKSGPFPSGLQTLTHDGEQFWITGRRLVLRPGLSRWKMPGRAMRVFAKAAA